MLNVARQFGYARITDDDGKDIAPALPAEPSRLAAIRDAVDTAYARFIAANPQWTWLEQTLTVTMDPTGTTALNGDSARYLLPVGVASRPQRSWLVTLPSGTWVGECLDTSPSRVLSVQADRSEETGPPIVAACRPTQDATTGATRWEVLVAPRPDQAYPMTADFRIYPVSMAELTDRHAAGAAHDQTIKDMACLAMVQGDASMASQVDRWQQTADRSLAQSLALDAEMQPGTLGIMPDAGVDDGPLTRSDVRRSSFFTVSYGAIP